MTTKADRFSIEPVDEQEYKRGHDTISLKHEESPSQWSSSSSRQYASISDGDDPNNVRTSQDDDDNASIELIPYHGSSGGYQDDARHYLEVSDSGIDARVHCMEKDLPEEFQCLFDPDMQLPAGVKLYVAPPLAAHELWLPIFSCANLVSLLFLLAAVVVSLLRAPSVYTVIYGMVAGVLFVAGVLALVPCRYIALQRENKFLQNRWWYGTFIGTDFVLFRPNPRYFLNEGKALCSLIPKVALTGKVEYETAFSPFRLFCFLFGGIMLLSAGSWTWNLTQQLLQRRRVLGALLEPEPGDKYATSSWCKETFAFIEYEKLNGRRYIYSVKARLVGSASIDEVRKIARIINEPLMSSF
eukprot:GEZU01007255.1.p1 GENE.GEZU01007255.1~~GEZU01007255.1.p1  ORF type:complete len:356 (+),score=13.52 GEZU01007255.1:60-1127(+)